MKILDRLPSILSTAQRFALEKILYNDIRNKKIIWTDVINATIRNRMPDLSEYINIPRIVATSNIMPDHITKTLEDIIITIIALASESSLINNLIGKHELFQKDTVKIYTDIATNFLNIVDNNVADYDTNNVVVENGIIAMAPRNIQEYYPLNINTTFYPDTAIGVFGNIPDVGNILPGTDSGYWKTQIITNRKCTPEARIVFDFGGIISFNHIIINIAGKYVSKIQKLETLQTEGWIEETNLDIVRHEKTIMINTMELRTKQIRITLAQDHYDFVWHKIIDNTESIYYGILKDDKILQEEKNKLINEVLIDNDKLEIIKTKEYNNVYEYTLGAYNIRFMLKIYNSKSESIFISKKYTSTSPIKSVRIIADNYLPGVSDHITYEILQHNEEAVIGTIEPNTIIPITKIFSKSEIFSDLTENVIELSSYPLYNEAINLSLNGFPVTRVDKFTISGVTEFIIKGKKIFINKNLSASIVNVNYKYHTDNIRIKINLGTGVSEDMYQSPRVENFDVIINEE